MLTVTECAVLYHLAVHAPNVLKKLRRKLGDDAADPRYIIPSPGWGIEWRRGRVRKTRFQPRPFLKIETHGGLDGTNHSQDIRGPAEYIH